MSRIALACRAAGLFEESEQLAARVWRWQTPNTVELALKLNTQVVFGADIEACRTTASILLARKRGHRWENTLATAWAVEALSQFMRFDRPAQIARGTTIVIDGKTVVDVDQRGITKHRTIRIHRTKQQLGKNENLTISMNVESQRPAHYSFTANGTLRLDKLKPSGSRIKIRRRLTTTDGRSIDRPLKVGEVVAVHLDIELVREQSYVIVEDHRPAGCEFAADSITQVGGTTASHVELRDDRISCFFAQLDAGRHEFVYYLRAETRGTSHLLPGIAYPMYDDQVRGETGALRVIIQ